MKPFLLYKMVLKMESKIGTKKGAKNGVKNVVSKSGAIKWCKRSVTVIRTPIITIKPYYIVFLLILVAITSAANVAAKEPA